MSRKSKSTRTREQLARRQQRQHIIVYVTLGTAIIAVQIFYPVVVDTAVLGVRTLLQNLVLMGKDGITLGLTIAALVYAWKKLLKS